MAAAVDWVGIPVSIEEAEKGIDLDAQHFVYLKPVVRPPLAFRDRFLSYRNARLNWYAPDFPGLLDALRGFRYVRDCEQFGRSDVWFHPEDFELVRAGDCEDHALWAWLQLLHLRLDARFVIGKEHCWNTFRQDSDWWLLESTSKDPSYQPTRADGAAGYVPQFSVDGNLQFYKHPG